MGWEKLRSKVEVKCTPEEKAAYQAAAGSLGVAYWLRSLANRELGRETPNRYTSKYQQKTPEEIAKALEDLEAEPEPPVDGV